MAFTIEALGRSSANLNLSVAIDSVADTNVKQGAFNIWTYSGDVAGDTLEQIFANNYFTTDQPPYNDNLNTLTLNFQKGDLFFINDVAGESVMARAATVTYPNEVAGDSDPGAIVIQVIPGGATPGALQFLSVPVSSAQFLNMDLVPVLIIPNTIQDSVIIIQKVCVVSRFLNAAYTGGGSPTLQYGSAIHHGGPTASNNMDPDAFRQAVRTVVQVEGVFNGADQFQHLSFILNDSVYMAVNGNFTTGQGTFVVNVWYYVIPTAAP